ncbi:MAG: GtrA family protein [Ruminococcaceae bacterium]|nr:GtrA family protein [Oscillospiraceae bacterium]
MKKLIEKFGDVLPYLFFGVLTTVVNYLVYLPCLYWFCLDAWLSNVLAWIAAVAFAYLTNKPFVFKSHDWSWTVVWPELVKFVSCRVGSGVLETGIIWLCVDMLGWNGVVMKLITAVLVIVLNYVGSKLLVFKKK